MTVKYDFSEILKDLDAGIFSAKLSQAIMDVAHNTIEFGETGKVTIELSMKRLGDSRQLQLDHTLKYTKPTLRGDASEKDRTATIMHVGHGGSLTLLPDTQGGFTFNPEEA